MCCYCTPVQITTSLTVQYLCCFYFEKLNLYALADNTYIFAFKLSRIKIKFSIGFRISYKNPRQPIKRNLQEIFDRFNM
jgi:hypothetical protein